MSFVLPRNVPKLTFTGSVRALGARRPRSEPPPLPPRERRARDVYAEEIPTPYLGSRPHMEAARPAMVPDSEEDIATMAMGRELVDRGLAAPARARAALPAFNIRNAVNSAGPALIVTPGGRSRSSRSPMMTVFWILAAILAAMVSYKYAPELLERVADAAKMLG